MNKNNNKGYEIYKYIDDIAFFRDINNDFEDRRFEDILLSLEKKSIELIEKSFLLEKGYSRVNVAIIGNFSSGKSTFVNSLLGKEICPMKVSPTTSSITKFIYSDKSKILLKDEKGSKVIDTEEYKSLVEHKTGETEKTPVYEFEYRYPFEHLRNITIIDTPGFENPKNSNDEKITEDIVVNNADIVFFVTDINLGIIEDKSQIRIDNLRKRNQRIEWYLLLNKADNKSLEAANKLLKKFNKKKYKKLFEKIFLYSSKKVLDHFKEKSEFRNKIIKPIYEGLLDENINSSINLFWKKEGRYKKTIIMDVNDEIIELKNFKKSVYLSSRKSILNVLNDISNNKKTYMKNKIEYLKSEYYTEYKSVMKEINNDIKKILDDKDDKSDDFEKFDIDINKFFDEFEKMIEINNKNSEIIFKNFYEKNIYASEIENTGFFYDDAEIKINANLKNKLMFDLEEILKKYIDFIKDWSEYFIIAHNFDGLIEFYSSAFTRFINESAKAIADYVYKFKQDNLIKFNSLKKAEEELPKIIVEISKDSNNSLFFYFELFFEEIKEKLTNEKNIRKGIYFAKNENIKNIKDKIEGFLKMKEILL